MANSTTTLQACLALLRRDLLLAIRKRAELTNPLLFFIIIVSLFPLALGPEPKILQRIAPAVIWVAALLSTLLSLESLFRSDFEDGSLEQMLMSPHPLSLLVFAKTTAHWLTTGFPLFLISPLLAILMNLQGEAMHALWITLLLGTPVLSLVGAIGVALTVGLRRGGVLLSLLILPLYVPVLIFSASAVDSAAAGLPVTGQLYIIAALLSLALVLAPFAAAAALRVSLE